jgi:maltokinase
VITADVLARLVPDYLVRQRWAGATGRGVQSVEVADMEVVHDEWPGLVWGLVEVTFDDGEMARFQLLVALRPVGTYETFLDGKGRFLFGDVNTRLGEALAYDALVDPELALEVVRLVAPDLEARLVRPLTVEQSNTSLIVDERWILKVFRRVHRGSNPDVELTTALEAAGFANVPATVATWRRGDFDLAVVREFLVGATEGFLLAQTSLRDLFSSQLPASESGGDFAPEVARLGTVTAQMHIALAGCFGGEPAEPARWAAELRKDAAAVAVPDVDPGDLAQAFDALERLTPDAAGRQCRIHGDFHLGQTVRTDRGWFVLDFEGEPMRPLGDRRVPASPLRDVAGLLRSLHYAAAISLLEQGDPAAGELQPAAREWEHRARQAFLDAYVTTPGIAGIIPGAPAAFGTVLDAFELGKAVYEVAYETAHRPAWVDIPAGAVRRLLTAESHSS